MTSGQFAPAADGKLHEVSVQQSAARLHAMFPDLDPTIFEAFLAVGRTWYVLTRLGAKYYAALGLTEHQLSTLRFLLLAESGRLTIGDIATLQATSSTNVTKLVNRMQSAGWVRRVSDENDRRVIWVELTDQGRERYIATMPTSALDRESFGVLSPEEQAQLIDMLARVRRKGLELAREQEGGLQEEPKASKVAAPPRGKRSLAAPR
jgi:DNA-binding MarR family transcriptional regulator